MKMLGRSLAARQVNGENNDGRKSRNKMYDDDKDENIEIFLCDNYLYMKCLVAETGCENDKAHWPMMRLIAEDDIMRKKLAR